MSYAAMALYGVGNTHFNPITLNQRGYYQGNLFVWTSINKLGVSFVGFISNSQIKQYLDQGKIVILNVLNVYVKDPGYSVSNYSLSEVVNDNTGVYTPDRLPNFIIEISLLNWQPKRITFSTSSDSR